MKSIAKGTASKKRIQPVTTTATEASTADASVTASALAGLKCSDLNLQRYVLPHNGSHPSGLYQ